jgi:Leucine-rich repeat (LRR) protein
MKNYLLFFIVCLMLYQTFCSDSGKARAENTVTDTLSWTWEVTSTASTCKKTCIFEFSDSLLINWGDGITEWIPDSLNSKTITHVYAVQANYNCTAIGVGISCFKSEPKKILNLDVTKLPNLTYLSFASNQVSSLDLTKNVLLTSLYCASNNLKILDLNYNTLLQTLSCNDNQLAELDLSMLSVLKKVTCHTNLLAKIKVYPSGPLNYLSCYGCSLSIESLDSIFNALPTLAKVSTSKNLYVLNNPGSSSCHSEIAETKNWTLDRVITHNSFYIPSVSCKVSDSVQVKIYLKNATPAIAFELDVIIPGGFTLDTLRSCLSSIRKGRHLLSVSKMSDTTQVYKFMAYSMKSKDSFSETDGAVLELFMKTSSEKATYTIDIQKALLIDTLTNMMDISITDGQIIAEAKSIVGDANGDGSVDVTDIVNLVAWIIGRHPAGIDTVSIDIDGDGLWNIVDITKLVAIVNTAETKTKSIQTKVLTTENQSLYLSGNVFSGNNLYVRQATDNSSCLEICLDNMDDVQAFQADLILPEGLSFSEDQIQQNTDRNSGQTCSICQLSANRYRLLSYALEADAAFTGKSGALFRLQIEGTEAVSSGTYPIMMQQVVLTGMDLKSVSSNTYDAVLKIEHSSESTESITFGTTAESMLWVKGLDLLELTVWDYTGRLIAQNTMDRVDYYSVPLKKGFYLVKVKSASIQECYQKVAVK